jgi:hypothetical protein
VPGIPHWPSRRLMGFLFCRGSKFRPRVQVFREALNYERLLRTATHTTRWQRAWPTPVEPAGCVAPVGSIQEESVQHRSPRFFLAVSTASPSYGQALTALSLNHCALSPRGSEVVEMVKSARRWKGGWLCTAIRLLRLPSEETIRVCGAVPGRAMPHILDPRHRSQKPQ